MPTHDQKMFLEDELKVRGLPYDHVSKIRFVEGPDENTNAFTRLALRRGHKAVTQGNTIYVRPDSFDKVTSFTEYTPFEEVYHTAQFKGDSNARFYNSYWLSMLGGVMSGLGPRDGNVQEAFAETEGKKMFRSYKSNRKRDRWSR
ncbi:hypothetical protein COO09_18765 [Rhizorhabdus dicambivorans]|uniref:Uncharacterized protein n=2 Tax=Rhizorhabdus dicambivorans TaxID=1850238 RepID=A0A2A4FTI9_9SPHN|nr:hypothetical protein CMV14_09655 [Rhizorhabdus dicambivorans]PCE40758.1 hypothetical protein COO09_18765 [Rhizorhabdus dicambivorans]